VPDFDAGFLFFLTCALDSSPLDLRDRDPGAAATARASRAAMAA
jgi:hypothetical protein